MRILIYGGSFNPPHIGHAESLRRAAEYIRADKCLVIPAGEPPHKTLPDGSPTDEQRLALCTLAFEAVPGLEVSDMELRREGKSYTADTLRVLSSLYPGDELFFLVGTDMFLGLEKWHDYEDIFRLCTVTVLPREENELPALRGKSAEYAGKYGAHTLSIPLSPVIASSTGVREALPLRRGRELLTEKVYAEIIRHRFYGARPELCWLRADSEQYLKPKRVPHVRGCAEEAVRLARRWGAEPSDAEEAAILHDITKKLSTEEQLCLCEKYGIVLSNADRASPPIWHAITGPYFARERYGISDEVFNAIRWHTTGRRNMSLPEKIIYMADYIEPNRDFPGVDEVRRLAYEDLDKAMILAMNKSLDHMRSQGIVPHPMTVEALDFLTSH